MVASMGVYVLKSHISFESKELLSGRCARVAPWRSISRATDRKWYGTLNVLISLHSQSNTTTNCKVFSLQSLTCESLSRHFIIVHRHQESNIVVPSHGEVRD